MTNKAALLGVDVGFSLSANTTGMAWRVNGSVGACVTRTAWACRSAVLPASVIFDVAALDAPLVPSGDDKVRRACEAAFYRGSFWNRCRPGMNHHGRGQLLRKAGHEAAAQFSSVVRLRDGVQGSSLRWVPIVEAFPNTFLGVLLSSDTYSGCNKFVKGQIRSDWLYERAKSERVFQRLLKALDWCEPATAELLATERDHDIRAALVCLLTAGFAAAGMATLVGDDVGGWFCLPPLELWAS